MIGKIGQEMLEAVSPHLPPRPEAEKGARPEASPSQLPRRPVSAGWHPQYPSSLTETGS